MIFCNVRDKLELEIGFDVEQGSGERIDTEE
jgi:hypothetical protein